ncbi:MAG: CPBP family intramembrane metalloprotease [Alphaproteobacteria bacterium]|nr:CPBP family intramembrane metalloprotease [Alphaproteobacteria bacterium]
METFERWFLDSDRRLTPLWRAIVYFTLTFFALPMILDPLAAGLAERLQLGTALTPGVIAFAEGEQLLIALIATGLFAWYEGRRIDSYFLPFGQALGRRTWEGVLTGVVIAGGVAIGMIALGGMQVHGIALSGTALLTFAIAWLIAMVLVGLAEELWFRAYFLKTLWQAIGFWPASLIIAGIFAAMHYFFKDGENVWDVITLLWFSLLICYSVRKTGTLWFAVGLHFAFDYMQFFVIGSPNGTLVPQGRLLDVTFNGPAWVTGGVLGTEASLLMYPMLALATLYVWRRDPTPALDQL